MKNGQHDHAHHGHHAHSAGGGGNTAASQVTDPVCGMNVDPKSAAGSHEHGGTTYYFCSKHCLATFKADPAKYLAKSAPPEVPSVTSGTQYTCPMHPEIVQEGPGSCPKCGMALVPIAGTGAAILTFSFWITVHAGEKKH